MGTPRWGSSKPIATILATTLMVGLLIQMPLSNSAATNLAPRTIYVDGGYGGYVGPEQGTLDRPFDTVNEANNSAGNSDQIIIRAGFYPETLTFRKRLKVTAEEGTVIIGRRGPVPSDFELAFYYAPIHYQDTDDDDPGPEADYITRVDYDGDWKADNNWNNFSSYRYNLKAYAYYSVVETCTHWFIVYTFYHPLDWNFDEHENDMEGFLAIVRKGDWQFGRLEGIITIAHWDFYSYLPLGSLLIKGQKSWQILWMDDTTMGAPARYERSWRAKTAQEAGGHGLKAWPFIKDFRGLPDQDGVIYFPSKTTAEVPSSGNDRDVKYQLLDIFAPNDGLWKKQLDEAPLRRKDALTYAEWGKLKGDDHGRDKAELPWRWDDWNDGPTYGGEMALDPANLVKVYFNDGLENFSRNYLRNRYITDLRDRGYGRGNLPRGWDSELDLGALFNKLTTCP